MIRVVSEERTLRRENLNERALARCITPVQRSIVRRLTGETREHSLSTQHSGVYVESHDYNEHIICLILRFPDPFS